MDITERIEAGINAMRIRGVEPECINLIKEDYDKLIEYSKSMHGDTGIVTILEYKGLQVTQTEGYNNKSFVSIIRKVYRNPFYKNSEEFLSLIKVPEFIESNQIQII